MKKVHRHLKGVHLVRRRRLPTNGFQPRLLADGTGNFAGYAHVALSIEYTPLCAFLPGANGRYPLRSELLNQVITHYLTNSLVFAYIAALSHQGTGVTAPEVLVRRIIEVAILDAPLHIIAAKIRGRIAVSQEVGEVLNVAERYYTVLNHRSPEAPLPECGVEADYYRVFSHRSIFFAYTILSPS